MTRLLVLLALVGLVLVVPRWASGALRIHGVYDHVDDMLGSGRWEADHPSLFRRLLAVASGNWREAFSPTHLRTVVNMPGGWRQRKYVRLSFRVKPWPLPYWREDVVQVSCRPTSEANVHGKNRAGITYFDALGMKVAQALGLWWTPELFEVTRHVGRRGRWTGWVTYRIGARTRTAKVPAQLPAAKEFDGAG